MGVSSGMSEVVIRSFEPSDAEWLVAQHRMLYARDEGFDESFGDLVAEKVLGQLGVELGLEVGLASLGSVAGEEAVAVVGRHLGEARRV